MACSSSRSTPVWSRTSRPTSPTSCRTSPPRVAERVPGGRQDVRAADRHRPGRLLVQQKKHFEQAGITEPPATWSAFLDAVKKLKAAGITPIALAGKEKWPGHYYWAYLALRIAGIEGLKQAETDHDFTKPDFIAAGQQAKALADLQPFQKGFLGAAYSTPPTARPRWSATARRPWS
ncbi:extracellular solute-binding protein [Nonomuraea salmonea]|uniref:extracellular solute-binding protein n=1 Tax=Nonomuraea salmonea TaxID=46181 RepID=UPI002FE80F7E